MSYADGHPGRDVHRSSYRTVLNESWPLRDRKGARHARGIPDQPNPIPVEVRLELDPDGEVWLPGRAARWTRTHVYVNGLADDRIAIRAVWVVAADVRRVSDAP